MKKYIGISSLCLIGLSPFLISWGIFGHECITHAAVLALPSPMQTFFYNHTDFVTQSSTIPDLRKYTMNDKAESPRHYINLENYGIVDSIPKTMEELKAKYNEKFISENGILPWHIEEMMVKLTKAFKQKRKTEILFLASDLGHYIGDAHMPLHTSSNHDGQLTGQKGIHAFWEAQLPDQFGKEFTFKISETKYIGNIQQEAWHIILASHRLVDTLLAADKEIQKKYPALKLYRVDSSGNSLKNKFNQPVHTNEYAQEYYKGLHGMIEDQMSKAISATASFWYTAWINAGKPDLADLDSQDLTKRNEAELKKEVNVWKQGKLIGITSEKEF